MDYRERRVVVVLVVLLDELVEVGALLDRVGRIVEYADHSDNGSAENLSPLSLSTDKAWSLRGHLSKARFPT